MFDRLAELEKKYEALGELLGSQEVIGDPKKYREHAKAFADLEKVVTLYRLYRGLDTELREAREMVNSSEEEELRDALRSVTSYLGRGQHPQPRAT